MVGIVQEQHPDRARLYQQWRRLGWPILVDALNVLDLKAVPIPMALDPSGKIRDTRLSLKELDLFLTTTFSTAARPTPPKATGDRARGDELFLDKKDLNGAIAAYAAALEQDPRDGRAHFRLGVAYRRRFEGPGRQAGDGQRAVEHWGRALAIDPNQYIWRRRLQQYGPLFDKPYDFYSWIERARKDIRARGEEPHPLTTEPRGSELALPRRAPSKAVTPPNPDPEGRITVDDGRLSIAAIATPARVRPGQRVRVRVRLSLEPKQGAYWNNEAEGLILSIAAVPDGALAEGRFRFSPPEEAETREDRVMELEILVDAEAKPGPRKLAAYVLYDICEGKAGVCLRRRQDFVIRWTVDPKAPKLG